MEAELKNDLLVLVQSWIGDYAFSPITDALAREMTRDLDLRMKGLLNEEENKPENFDFPITFDIGDIGEWELTDSHSSFKFKPNKTAEALGVKSINHEDI